MTSKHFANYIEHQIVDLKNLQIYHKDVQEIAKMACIPWELSPSKFLTFDESRIWDIAINNPILCVVVKSKMYVIGGFRTWNIAMSYYREKNKKTAKVPVQIINHRMKKSQRIEIAASSLLLSLISQSLGKRINKHIGCVWTLIEELAPGLYEHFFDHGSATKSRLPKTLGQSYASFYPKEKS